MPPVTPSPTFAHSSDRGVSLAGCEPPQPSQIALFFYPPPCRATRLGVEATVANDLRMMLEEIACTPWSERLLVRHHAQGHLPTQGLTPFASIEERKERCRGAGLHIAGTAAVNLAVDKVSAPRVMSPAFSGSDWENVDVPIEGEIPTWFARGKWRRYLA